MFILRLATEVNWSAELDCFETFAQEIARFYSLRNPVYFEEHTTDAQPVHISLLFKSLLFEIDLHEVDCNWFQGCQSWNWTTEHVLYPAMRSTFLPASSQAQDRSILQLANLHDLYKVFERC